MITIKDIARISGFSANTVSNALRDRDNVKKETKDIIQKVAGDLSYVPNNVARSLVLKKSFLIALVIHSIKDPFYSEVISHLEYLIYSSKYNLVLFNHNEDIKRQDRILQSILEQKIGAVIITPVLSDTTAVEKLKSCNIPFILLARNYKDFKADFVGIDFDYSMGKVVDHFVKYGRKNILNICGSNATHSSKMRLSGYKNALKAHDIEFDNELVLENINGKEHLWNQLDTLIKIKKKVDAVYCYDFNSTSAVLEFCKINSIKIPENIAIIGFEFKEFCINTYVPLTAIKYNTDEISEKVWLILNKLMAPTGTPKKIENIYTKSELVIRKSCGE